MKFSYPHTKFLNRGVGPDLPSVFKMKHIIRTTHLQTHSTYSWTVAWEVLTPGLLREKSWKTSSLVLGSTLTPSVMACLGLRASTNLKSCVLRVNAGTETCCRYQLELRQSPVTPLQKHWMQPNWFLASRWKVFGLHWLQVRPVV